jgi:hypothetical protein
LEVLTEGGDALFFVTKHTAAEDINSSSNSDNDFDSKLTDKSELVQPFAE